MSTANELFAETSVEEPHIVIGSDRKIKIPDSLTRLGVQHDHNIETVIFDCPRYWDDHDMSKMVVYINYMLSNGYTDAYPADNIKAEGDIMHFSWTISRNVTQVSGVVNFLVCVKNTDQEGNEVNHWNSELCQEAYISKGMETEEMGALEQSDLITSLLLRMDSVEKINVQASEMRDLVTQAQTAADTAIVAKNVAVDETNQIKNSFANAVKGKVSGEVVTVDDVSPVEHTINTRVHGKNLWKTKNIEDSFTGSQDFIYSYNNGTITFKGTTENEIGGGRTELGNKSWAKITLPKGTYTYSINVISGSMGTYATFMQAVKDGVVSILDNYTFTLTETCTVLFGINKPDVSGIEIDVTFNIQIEEGTVATDYEPYIDPTSVTVTACGKNLSPIKDITVAGLSAWTSKLAGLIKLPAGIYTAKCKFEQTGTDKSIASLYIRDYDNTSNTIKYTRSTSTNGELIVTFELTSDIRGICVRLYSNDTKNVLNTECKFTELQIECGESATDYEEFLTTGTCIPDTNGIAYVTSVSPTTTIFTDTPGAIIEAEYNRDTIKIFEYIDQKIADLKSELQG